MTARDSSGPLELNVDPEVVRRIVAVSRAALFEMPQSDADDPVTEAELDPGTGFEEGDTARLSDEEAPYGMRIEAAGMIDSLNVDQQAELVALTLIGRGDYEPGELEIAVREAKERATGPASGMLLEMEVFPTHLESGLDTWETWRSRQAV